MIGIGLDYTVARSWGHYYTCPRRSKPAHCVTLPPHPLRFLDLLDFLDLEDIPVDIGSDLLLDKRRLTGVRAVEDIIDFL